MAQHLAYDTDKRIIYVTTAPINEEINLDFKQDFYSDMKVDWQSDVALGKFKFPIRSVGGDSLPGSKNLGASFFLDSDWKIRPYEENHIFRINGNVYSEDGTSVMIPTIGNYQVLSEMFVSNLVDSTVAQLSEIEQASYEGGVSIDQTNHTGDAQAGTDYPIGTPRIPSSNLIDVYTISQLRGLYVLYVQGNLVVSDEADYADYTFYGESSGKTLITLNPEATIVGAEFYQASVQGTLDGGSILRECSVGNLDYIEGQMIECILEPGTVYLSTDNTSLADIYSCRSGVPGVSTPTIDMGGDGAALALRNYNGGSKLTNKTGSADVSVDLNSGQIILTATYGGTGTTVVRGVGKLVDENGDAIPSGNWNGGTVVNETTSYLMDQLVGGDLTEQDKQDIANKVWDTLGINHGSLGSFGEIVQTDQSITEIDKNDIADKTWQYPLP